MKLLTACILFLIVVTATGQDVIHYCNGKTDSAIIEQITPDEIVFKKYHLQQGPDYRVPKTAISVIVLSSGKEMILSGCDKEQAQKRIDTRDSIIQNRHGKNIIGINGLAGVIEEEVTRTLAISYERTIKKGTKGIKAELNFMVIKNRDNTGALFNRVYSLRVDYKHYPKKQRYFGYFLGPSARFGFFTIQRKNFTIRNPISETYTSTFLFFNNGIYANPFPRLYIDINCGLGVVYLYSTYSYERFLTAEALAGVSLGWRF